MGASRTDVGLVVESLRPPSATSSSPAASSSDSGTASASGSASASSTGSASSTATPRSVAPAAVGPGLTAASSFSKSGTDTTSGSTANSATGTVGTTSPGRTIDWVLHYSNTSGAVAAADVTDKVTGQDFVAGSLKAPPGFTPSWSTDGGSTYSTTEPLTGVNAVQAGGREGPATGDATAFPASSHGFVGASNGGDGYEAIFFNGNVYNVHHHAAVAAGGNTLMDCHVKASGAVCPGFAPSGIYASTTAGDPFTTTPLGGSFTTPENPSSGFDPTTGRIFAPISVVAGGTNEFGLLCLDVMTNTYCGFHSFGTDFNNQAISGASQVGTQIFAADFDGDIHCYDYSTDTDCGVVVGFPGFIDKSAGNVDAFYSRAETFGTRVFVNYVWHSLSDARYLLCEDATTHAICPGFPKGVIAPGHDVNAAMNVTMEPVLSTTGTPTGVCVTTNSPTAPNGGTAQWACFNFAGATIPVPYPTGLQPGVIGSFQIGDGAVIGTKVYLPYESNQTRYACLDFALTPAAPCAGYTVVPRGTVSPYTLRQDPAAPNCIWEVGDLGIFDTFNALTGGSCSDVETTLTSNPDASYCDGQSGHVTGWSTLTISGASAAQYKGAIVSITDSAGTPVPGFENVSLTNAQPTLDISSIPFSGSTSTLKAKVILSDLATGVDASLSVGFTGDPVQVCFQTKVPDACPVAGGSVSNTANVVTTGANGVTDAPAGNSSGAATFNDTTVGPCGLVASKVLAAINGVPLVAGQEAKPGDVLLFEVTVSSTELTIDTTTLTETVGTGLTYTGTGEGWSAGCTTAGTTCEQPVPVPPGGSRTVNFTETVVDPIPPGTTTLTNTVLSSVGDVVNGTVELPTEAVALIGSWPLAAGFAVLVVGGFGGRRLRLRRRAG